MEDSLGITVDCVGISAVPVELSLVCIEPGVTVMKVVIEVLVDV